MAQLFHANMSKFISEIAASETHILGKTLMTIFIRWLFSSAVWTQK